MPLLKFSSCSGTKYVTSFSPSSVRQALEDLFSLQIHQPLAVGHTHHPIHSGIRSGSGSTSLLKQVASFHTTHIHPQYLQLLEHYTIVVSVPSLSCFIREVWHYQFNHCWNPEEGNRLSFTKKKTIRVWHTLGVDKATWNSYSTLASLSNYSFLWILECD